MQVSWRELVTMIHGMLFGGLFLLAGFGAMVLWYRSLVTRGATELTDAGRRWERVYLATMVALGWAAVLTGAYVIYPWYRAPLPAGVTDLTAYPQRLLLSDPRTAGWHTLGMEWKEHVAWFAPMLMTAAAWVWMRYEGAAEEHRRVRVTVAAIALAAVLATGVAAEFGALINKQAPLSRVPAISAARGTP